MNTNLLDLYDDILNIIGDYVKIDNKNRIEKKLMNEEQIINGKKIKFGELNWRVNRSLIKVKNNISKDLIYP